MNEIYFFGAGFSKSLSSQMPLLDELTEELIKTDIGNRWKDHGNIEDILTFLSHPFPWESSSYSLRKKADFLDLSTIVGNIISERQSHQFDLSDAHKKFFQSLCKNFSPIITLNYDALLELVLMQSEHKQSIDDIYPVVLTNVESRGGAGLWSEYPGTACQIYKLHGSVNWFYSGNENYFGEQIYFSKPSAGKAQNAKNISDKVNLIVPPTYDKSVFMNNETIRDLWRLAKERIGFSKRIVFVGYSFPKSDLMIRYFLRDACTKIEEIVIVDKNPEVLSRAEEIFAPKKVMAVIAENPIEEYVNKFCDPI